MFYIANDYSSLLGLEGFSDELLKNHFKLYEGYIKNANKLLEASSNLLENGKTAHPQFSEAKKRLSFELNGIHLHEYYFENMSKEADGEPEKGSLLHKKISEEFGGWSHWKKSFQGVAMMRGVGWAVMIYDPRSKLFINTWVDEHHIGHVAGTTPILVLDLWEHAMLLDYGSDREKYIDAFFNVIDWEIVASRYAKALELQMAQHV